MTEINPYLEENELIIYETKPIIERESKIILYVITSPGILFISLYIPMLVFSQVFRDNLDLMLIFMIIIYGFIFITGTYLLKEQRKEKRTVLYITSQNVIKFTNKKKFHREPKIQKITHDNIDHIITWVDSVDLYQKNQKVSITTMAQNPIYCHQNGEIK
ncbi:MAG: hypothetical protein ACFFA3_18515 [Promethearchaeota archaeon]